MTLRVLLFAHLRDRLGPVVDVELPDGATVANLRARLPIEGCRVAVNLAFAEDGDVIPPGAEVAAIPPVSGG
jgi:molybdopterin converting factor small subunit